MSLINWIVNKMGIFNKQNIKQKLNTEIALTNEEISNIELWYKMLVGNAPWCKKFVKSAGMEYAICREFSNCITVEMDTYISDEILDNVYQESIANLNEYLQKGLALGSCILKPVGTEGVQFVDAYNFIPLRKDIKGQLTKVAFLDRKYIKDNNYLVRVEIHDIKEDSVEITQKAFKSTNGYVLDNEVSLSSNKEWEDLLPKQEFQISTPTFAYFSVPILNKSTNNIGQSVYANSVNIIEKIDKQEARLDWEYDSGERAVIVSEQMLYSGKNGNNGLKKYNERLYRGALLDNSLEAIHDYNPILRDDNFIKGLNEYKRELEFNVGLAYGDLSKNETIEKTATEIMVSKSRKQTTVKNIERNVKSFLSDLVNALAFYYGRYNKDYEFVCDFNDNILIDEETEKQSDRIDVSMGLMSAVEYRMKWYNETKEEAEKNVPDPLLSVNIDE